ncbi:myc box-dependent-interacting protein 1 isoform X2 [Parasteatoda tepidariorum]|uniref:myc box-dependent-interacting protein 1 isoform X2 n=2 Tax=Parasteatoda tepidariorum TaxID=114398 RepID=UPI000A2BFF71|nr:myc box-dependent-interacting protein 1 isoform X2 [Parasteatoda tepidariorum]
MASDNRAGSLSKSVQKHAGRAKERILQNLGKADRTTDDILNLYMSNFNKQHASAQRLSKEFKNYVSCARAMQAASKSLMDTLTEMYEPSWVGCEQIPVKTQVLEMVWDDFCHKLNDQVGVPVATYLSQFPEIRGKIAKRGRKLVDYDKCRHNLQSLQQPNRKREEMKIGKAKERLDEARKMYEVINNELHDELPALYDSRISFLVTNLQTMFTSESQFHNENNKIFNQLSEVVENLSLENQKGKYRTRKPGSPLILKSDGDTRHYEEIEFRKSQARMSGHISNGEIISSNTLPSDKKRDISLTVSQTNAMNSDNTLRDSLRKPAKIEKDYEPVEVNELNQMGDSKDQKLDELYDIPVGATTTDLPAGVLYRVRATYKYTGEDVDELSFEIGDIIRVVEYEDLEEQEEGWLMGMKEATGEKGLFPANFTRPI